MTDNKNIDNLTQVANIPIKNVPPKQSIRNSFGLLEDVNYVFKEDGSIDWLRMCPPNNIYIKPLKPNQIAELEAKYDKPINDIKPIEDNVEEKYLAISLAGLRQLARIKGYSSVDFDVKEANPNYACVKCTVNWLPNYESQGLSLTRSDVASVIPETTNWMTKSYIAELAANRAEARVLRTSMGIVCVSREELSPNQKEEAQMEEAESGSPIAPKNIALKKIKELGFSSFADVLKAFNKINIVKYNDYDKLDKVPGEMIMGLMGDLNKLK
jgi:hypothetical protein